jgi:hypothetical protein
MQQRMKRRHHHPLTSGRRYYPAQRNIPNKPRVSPLGVVISCLALALLVGFVFLIAYAVGV